MTLLADIGWLSARPRFQCPVLRTTAFPSSFADSFIDQHFSNEICGPDALLPLVSPTSCIVCRSIENIQMSPRVVNSPPRGPRTTENLNRLVTHWGKRFQMLNRFGLEEFGERRKVMKRFCIAITPAAQKELFGVL